ncbi:unnamed protein product, partial [Prorocentrum cordatum]
HAETDSANFKHNKAQWRADVLPFKCADRTSAISQVRQALTIESDMKVERSLSGRKVKKLTKKRYAHYMNRKEGMELDAAEDNFEDLFEENPLYNSDGEEVVEVKGDSYDVREKGTEINKGSLTKTVRSSSAAPSGLQNLGSHQVLATPSARPAESVISGGGLRGDEKGPTVRTGAGRRGSKRQRLGGEDKGEHVVALQEKEDMMKRLSDMMKPLAGAKSATAKLKKLWDKHRAEVDAPKDCGEIIEKLEAVSKEINDLHAVVSKSVPETVNEHGDKLNTLETKQGEFSSLAATRIASLEYINATVVEGKRKVYLAMRHQTKKVVDALKGGGFDANLAKYVGGMTFRLFAEAEELKETAGHAVVASVGADVVLNPEREIDLTKNVVAWTVPPENVQKMVTTLRDQIAEATEKSDVAMARNISTWNGCQTKVNFPETDFGFGENLHAGSGPFVATAKKNAVRIGPSAFPLVGWQGYVYPVKGNLIVFLFEISEVLSSGIALKDMKKSLSTATAEQFFETSVQAVYLPVGTCLSTPIGTFAVPLFYSDAKAQKADATADWAHFIHMPVFAHPPKPVHKGVLTGMNDIITAHMAPLTNEMWVSRKNYWATFYSGLIKETSES